jgi:hypothetical protein
MNPIKQYLKERGELFKEELDVSGKFDDGHMYQKLIEVFHSETIKGLIGMLVKEEKWIINNMLVDNEIFEYAKQETMDRLLELIK